MDETVPKRHALNDDALREALGKRGEACVLGTLAGATRLHAEAMIGLRGLHLLGKAIVASRVERTQARNNGSQVECLRPIVEGVARLGGGGRPVLELLVRVGCVIRRP